MPTSAELRNKILERDGFACVACGSSISLELAHITPRAFGGTDDPGNLVALCAACNRSLSGRVRYFDFESTLFRLLSAHPNFRDVKQHVFVPDEHGAQHDVDIVAERRTGKTWHPIRLECRLGALTFHRLQDELERVQAIRGGGATVVLALAIDIPGKYRTRLTNAGVEVWTISDIANQLGSALSPKDKSITAALLRTRLGSRQPPTVEQELISDLKACPPGKTAWMQYQQLVGRLLNHLFCPPLETPADQSTDSSMENRRDYVFANYAEAGFWAFLRQQYQADFVVVDAKNYTNGVKKRDVLQVAHYLKPHGAGLLAIIASRKLPAKDARSAAREAWISQRKLILFLDDSDIESMVLAKAAGRSAELLIRQKLEDFRLSL